MTTADELARYARTLRGQQQNYELCRDAAKSLTEHKEMLYKLATEHNKTLRELNELRRAVDYFKDSVRRLGLVVK